MSVSFAPKRLPLLAAGTLLALACVLLGLRWPLATPAAPSDDDGRGVLLGLAEQAEQDHRLVAPAGSNAYEFYLSALELAPQDAPTREALHRLFPAATQTIEETIDRDELDEAERELRLLRDFDGDNYTVALLAGKLAAERGLATRRHEARAAMIRARMADAAQPVAR
ncbi:MAG TPA: energy transducer TonB [Frateuria sp.]|uniref:energy transducer TonB n=1 Tax=Frateuria sp. TaxID=2211372 RepID=UPI002DEE6924|nr:energy transducer TonB [Frateuria sp.]